MNLAPLVEQELVEKMLESPVNEVEQNAQYLSAIFLTKMVDNMHLSVIDYILSKRSLMSDYEQ